MPDDVITSMTKERLSKPDTSKGFILDGYPRTLVQARALDQFAKLDLVVNIEFREDLLVYKTISRRVCSQCGKGYNFANIQDGEIEMSPLLPKKDGVCDKVYGDVTGCCVKPVR